MLWCCVSLVLGVSTYFARADVRPSVTQCLDHIQMRILAGKCEVGPSCPVGWDGVGVKRCGGDEGRGWPLQGPSYPVEWSGKKTSSSGETSCKRDLVEICVH